MKTKYNGVPITFRILEHGHSGDPSGSTTVQTDKIISLKAFDAKEPNNSNSDRKSYGNNRYTQSNILQWLNSTAAAGAWYSAQHSTDAAPTTKTTDVSMNPYTSEAGFLANFSSELKAEIKEATKTVAKNTITDGGGSETITRKVWLLSTTEVGLANENNIAEGTIYAYFSQNNTNARRIMYPTQQCINNADSDSRPSATSAAWYWWLRTPSSGYASGVRRVFTDGSLINNGAYNGHYGLVPALCLSSTLKVSDNPDSDGAYTIMWNSAPSILTPSASLGDKNAPFDVTWSCMDPDGDSVSAVVKLDGVTDQSIPVVTQGQAYTYSITAAKLRDITTGSHTITITATDSNSNAASKNITFNRTVSPVNISGDDGDLGNYWTKPAITYQVSEIGGKDVTVVESYGSGHSEMEHTRTIEHAPLDTDITVNLDAFNELSIGQTVTITITATNSDGAEATRTWTFTRLADRLEFYMNAIETDVAARKINVILNYSEENMPAVKVEATNNARAISPVWEDITTEWAQGKTYYFQNEPEADFGVAVKITITKNERTERVYVTSLGYAFA